MADRLDDFVGRLLGLSLPGSGRARRLPPERELCRALDISRGALREQLATLESLGILRRRQGQGSYIDAPDASFVRTYFTLLRRLDYLSGERFTEAREMLEETIAAEAAIHATDADVEQLRRDVDVMISESIAGHAHGALEADFAFHTRLYAIVDNPIFNMLDEGLRHVLHEDVRVRREFAALHDRRSADGSINTDRVHGGIVDALAERSPDRARAAMRRHFTDFTALRETPPPGGKP